MGRLVAGALVLLLARKGSADDVSTAMSAVQIATEAAQKAAEAARRVTDTLQARNNPRMLSQSERAPGARPWQPLSGGESMLLPEHQVANAVESTAAEAYVHRPRVLNEVMDAPPPVFSDNPEEEEKQKFQLWDRKGALGRYLSDVLLDGQNLTRGLSQFVENGLVQVATRPAAQSLPAAVAGFLANSSRGLAHRAVSTSIHPVVEQIASLTDTALVNTIGSAIKTSAAATRAVEDLTQKGLSVNTLGEVSKAVMLFQDGASKSVHQDMVHGLDGILDNIEGDAQQIIHGVAHGVTSELVSRMGGAAAQDMKTVMLSATKQAAASGTNVAKWMDTVKDLGNGKVVNLLSKVGGDNLNGKVMLNKVARVPNALKETVLGKFRGKKNEAGAGGEKVSLLQQGEEAIPALPEGRPPLMILKKVIAMKKHQELKRSVREQTTSL